jgi:antitoxin (DNA-binding transcriptional repressor) of toxin-antitoxin stability system
MGGTMKITASKLREDIYKILDEVIATGREIEIIRKGEVVKLVPQKRLSKLSRLTSHDYSNEDPEFFTHIDWSATWSGEITPKPLVKRKRR